MLMLRTKKFRFKNHFLSKRNELRVEIVNHCSWKGALSLCEIASFLKNSTPFTFVLSEGMDEDHFFLSFVDCNGIVKHKNVRILRVQSNWVIKNGTGNYHFSIESLIPDCLHCSASVCKPFA